jgi:peroxiredoxin
MAVTPSNMMALGTDAPEFHLLDVLSGKMLSLDNVKGENGLVVMFICVHCPYVIHLQEEIAFIAENYQHDGIRFVAINSNSIESHPQDGPEHMKTQAEDQDFTFPYLFDTTQEVAKAYDAACTPDFFLFNEELKLVYRGRFDSASPGNNEPVTGDELRDAMDSLLSEEPISEDQHPSIGCNIKWK